MMGPSMNKRPAHPAHRSHRSSHTRIGTWLESELILRQLRASDPGYAAPLDSLAKAMGIGPSPAQLQEDRELLGESLSPSGETEPSPAPSPASPPISTSWTPDDT